VTQDIARSTARISLPVAFLIVALGCEVRSPSAPQPELTETLAPTPSTSPIRYNLSGIVTDDDGLPVVNAQLELYHDNTFKTAKTSTDARGHYSITFETVFGNFDGNPRVVGAIYYTGGGDYENNYVQAVPWGTADVVKNLRLRRVRTINAGESVVISIEDDSSLAYDGDDYLRMDSLWEKFHVRVADAGILTVDARPAEGTVPRLDIACRFVIDNCLGSHFVNGPIVPGKSSRFVNANSLFEIRLAIPTPMAPQRYKVSTFLER